MQLAIDGLIALVVVVSHLVILARMAYLDVFTYRYIPYVIVVTAVKWLAKVLWQIDIPDAIYLLVFIFLEKPQALREEKYFYAFFSPVFWTLITSFFSFYLFRVFFNKPVELVPNHLGILAVDSVVLPFFLGLQLSVIFLSSLSRRYSPCFLVRPISQVTLKFIFGLVSLYTCIFLFVLFPTVKTYVIAKFSENKRST